MLTKAEFNKRPKIVALRPDQRKLAWLAYQRKFAARRAATITPARKGPQPRKPPKMNRMTFTQCLVSYAKAAIDPFDQSISEACIPDNNAMPSHKFSSYINAQAFVGTQGVAIIGLNPWTMTARDFGASITHSDFSLTVSTAAYASATIDFDRADIGAALAVENSNSFYGVAQVSTQAMRLVGAAIEIFYTGPTLTQAGAVTTLQTAGLQTLPTGTTVASLRNDPRSRTCSVSKGSRCYVAYQPISDDLLSYKPNSTYMPSVTPSFANIQGIAAPLLIVVSGATPGTTFQVKAVAHFEGLYPGMGTTPSHADPIGFPSFLAARAAVVPSDNPKNDLAEVLKKTAKTIAGNLAPYLPGLGLAVGSAFGVPQAGMAIGNAGRDVLQTLLDGKSVQI